MPSGRNQRNTKLCQSPERVNPSFHARKPYCATANATAQFKKPRRPRTIIAIAAPANNANPARAAQRT